MKIVEMNIKEYLDTLKTKSPVPGGGSVSGLSAVQGVSLVLMVCELTLNNKKYEEFYDLNNEILRKSTELYNKLLCAADNDKEAFSKLSEAYKIPKDADKRDEVLNECSIGATKAPFDVIKLSFEGIKFAFELLDKSNKMAISDLGVAAECFRNAAKSAWLNVKINLPYINDTEKKEIFFNEGEKLLSQIERYADKIYLKVESML